MKKIKKAGLLLLMLALLGTMFASTAFADWSIIAPPPLGEWYYSHFTAQEEYAQAYGDAMAYGNNKYVYTEDSIAQLNETLEKIWQDFEHPVSDETYQNATKRIRIACSKLVMISPSALDWSAFDELAADLTHPKKWDDRSQKFIDEYIIPQLAYMAKYPDAYFNQKQIYDLSRSFYLFRDRLNRSNPWDGIDSSAYEKEFLSWDFLYSNEYTESSWEAYSLERGRIMNALHDKLGTYMITQEEVDNYVRELVAARDLLIPLDSSIITPDENENKNQNKEQTLPSPNTGDNQIIVYMAAIFVVATVIFVIQRKKKFSADK